MFWSRMSVFGTRQPNAFAVNADKDHSTLPGKPLIRLALKTLADFAMPGSNAVIEEFER